MLKCNMIGCLTAIYEKDKVGLVHTYNIEKRNDYAFWLKVLKYTDRYNVGKCLAKYRVTKSSLSKRNKSKLPKYNFEMFRKSEGFSIAKSLYLTFINIVKELKRK